MQPEKETKPVSPSLNEPTPASGGDVPIELPPDFPEADETTSSDRRDSPTKPHKPAAKKANSARAHE